MPAYMKTLTYRDFDWDYTTPTDVAVVAATWTKLAAYVNNDPNSVIYMGAKHGYFYAKMIDDTATDATEETGEHRFVVADPNEIVRKVVFQVRSELASADTTDKTKKLKLDLIKPGVKYKSQLIWEFKSDAADSLQPDNSVIYLDVTQVIA